MSVPKVMERLNDIYEGMILNLNLNDLNVLCTR